MNRRKDLLARLELVSKGGGEEEVDVPSEEEDIDIPQEEKISPIENHYLVTILYKGSSTPELFLVHKEQVLALLTTITNAISTKKSVSFILSKPHPENSKFSETYPYLYRIEDGIMSIGVEEFIDGFRGIIHINDEIKVVRVIDPKEMK